MTEEERARKDAEEKAEKERADAAGDDKMQKLLDGIGAISQACDSIRGEMDSLKVRMDAMEGGTVDPAADKARKDAEEKEAEEKAKKDADVKAEKDRKDAEEKAEKEEKDRKDAAARSADPAMAARLAAVEAAVKPRADAEHNQIADAWTKANSVMIALGDSSGASAAMPGEELPAYRRRLLIPMQAHSAAWKEVDLSLLPAKAFDNAETQIRRDAMDAAMSPSAGGGRGLRPMAKTENGHTIITWAGGQPSDWMRSFAGGGQRAEGDWKHRSAGAR